VVENEILKFGWEHFVYANEAAEGFIKVIERELDEVPGDGWYESHPQGHEGNIYLVFEVNGKFWRKTGTTDSYGEREWDGTFREVTKGEVVVTKYEWKEN
jgi:hypothetical protein